MIIIFLIIFICIIDDIKTVNIVLRFTRNFFIKSPSLVPILLNLIEQGGLSAIKGKALLTTQLISKYHPSIFVLLIERRLSSLLLRLVTPILANYYTDTLTPTTTTTTTVVGVDGNKKSQKGTIKLMDLSYLVKASFSMIFYITDTCREYLRVIIGILVQTYI